MLAHVYNVFVLNYISEYLYLCLILNAKAKVSIITYYLGQLYYV